MPVEQRGPMPQWTDFADTGRQDFPTITRVTDRSGNRLACYGDFGYAISKSVIMLVVTKNSVPNVPNASSARWSWIPA